jgi:DNA-binding transcriptional ArsR family regulator
LEYIDRTIERIIIMATLPLTPELIELIAERFKVLSEPARLRLLNALREGEKTVTELMEATGLGQANVSKHLQLLHFMGFVTRRKSGLYVYYGLADEDVFALCDLMCGRLQAQEAARRTAFDGR